MNTTFRIPGIELIAKHLVRKGWIFPSEKEEFIQNATKKYWKNQAISVSNARELRSFIGNFVKNYNKEYLPDNYFVFTLNDYGCIRYCEDGRWHHL